MPKYTVEPLYSRHNLEQHFFNSEEFLTRGFWYIAGGGGMRNRAVEHNVASFLELFPCCTLVAKANQRLVLWVAVLILCQVVNSSVAVDKLKFGSLSISINQCLDTAWAQSISEDYKFCIGVHIESGVATCTVTDDFTYMQYRSTPVTANTLTVRWNQSMEDGVMLQK